MFDGSVGPPLWPCLGGTGGGLKLLWKVFIIVDIFAGSRIRDVNTRSTHTGLKNVLHQHNTSSECNFLEALNLSDRQADCVNVCVCIFRHRSPFLLIKLWFVEVGCFFMCLFCFLFSLVFFLFFFFPAHQFLQWQHLLWRFLATSCIP